MLGPATLLTKYGSFAVAGVVCLESMGLPLPGEAILIAAAIYAGKTGGLNIVEVIAATAAGAIVGDNIGYWIGREIGFPVLLRYGRYIGLTEPRIKLGQYLFMQHGGKIVFFGRFVALLRALAASWPASIACRGRASSSPMRLAPFCGRQRSASAPTRSVRMSSI